MSATTNCTKCGASMPLRIREVCCKRTLADGTFKVYAYPARIYHCRACINATNKRKAVKP